MSEPTSPNRDVVDQLLAKQLPPPKPSVGHVVHYVSYGTPGGEYASECRAAIITEVVPLDAEEAAQAEIESWPDDHRCRVGLAVLNPTGMFFNRGCHQDEAGKRGGTWHWPTSCLTTDPPTPHAERV